MRDTLKIYLQPAFLICVGVLALAASSMSAVIRTFGIYLKNEPLPLKKSLDLLDEEDLAPYKVILKEKIENKEIVETLGTKDYIQWTLEDEQVPENSPVRRCSLFITYYSLPDRVPHVPEECYMGSGFQQLASESLSLEVKNDGFDKTVPIRYLVFAKSDVGLWGESGKFPVLYLFSVNGEYANSREEARIFLNKNLFSKYSYFSKVEWKFFNMDLNKIVYPNKTDAIEASKKLIRVLLPILEKEYWPEKP